MKKVLVVAAVKEEVSNLNHNVVITGIGKHNAVKSLTETLLCFSERLLRDLVILNVGTVGSKDFKVGTILDITESIDKTRSFLKEEQSKINNNISDNLREKFKIEKSKVLSVEEFQSEGLDETLSPVAIDMELSSLVDVCEAFEVPLLSVKIVSDNLDSSLEEWWKIVKPLSLKLTSCVQQFIQEIELD